MNYEQFYSFAFNKLVAYLYTFYKCNDTRRDIVQSAMIYYWQYCNKQNKTVFDSKDLAFCKNMVRNRLIDLIRTNAHKATAYALELDKCFVGNNEQERTFEIANEVHTLLRTLPSAEAFAITQKLAGFYNVRANQIIYRLRNAQKKAIKRLPSQML